MDVSRMYFEYLFNMYKIGLVIFFGPDEKSLGTMLGFIDTIQGMLSDGHITARTES